MNTIATASMPSAMRALERGAHRARDRARARPCRRRARARRPRRRARYSMLRLDDVLGENLRPRLVADAQRVAEALVVSSSVRSPLRSSSALVATVVPIFTAPIAAGRDRLAGLRAPSRSRMPCDGGVAIGLRDSPTAACGRRACRPAARPTTSVKVPPRSIQKSHWFLEFRACRSSHCRSHAESCQTPVIVWIPGRPAAVPE